MFELIVEEHFAAAHYLRNYRGPCENLHGHNWKVEVVVQSETLNETGMVIDFKDIKASLRKVLDEFDHTCLNDLPRFKTVNPTTENIAKIICDELRRQLPENVSVKSVTSWESEKCGAKYSPKP